jgi:hypothetical protein
MTCPQTRHRHIRLRGLRLNGVLAFLLVMTLQCALVTAPAYAQTPDPTFETECTRQSPLNRTGNLGEQMV